MGRETEKKIEVEKTKKLGWVIPISILIMGLIFLGGFLPVFYDFSQMQIVVKILFIACYIVGLVLLITLVFYDKTEQNEEKNSWKDKVFIGFLSAIYIIGFLMFLDHNLWGYKEAVYGIMFLVVLFVEIFISINVVFGKKLDSEKLPTILISAAVLTFLLAAVNETSNNVEPANLLYKLSFGIAYLIAVALFINSYLFKKRDNNKTIGNIVGIVFWGSLILVTFPYYVQWCGLKENDFQTFVTVYAALIGGGITLAGVAWTIKDSNEKRKEDLQRVEMERKEEERKKNIPYIKSVDDVLYDSYINIPLKNHYDFYKIEDRSKFTNKQVYSVQFSELGIKNVSDTHIIFNSIALNNRFYSFSGILIEKGQTCKITFNNNSGVVLHESLNSIKLIMCDMVGNSYEIECKYAHSQSTPPQSELETTDDGVDYTLHARSYIIQKVSLPEHIKKEFEHE